MYFISGRCEVEELNIWRVYMILIPQHGNPHMGLIKERLLDISHNTFDLRFGSVDLEIVVSTSSGR